MQLYHANCIEIMKQMPKKSVDMILTDPPYLMQYCTRYRKDSTHEYCKQILNDNNPELIAEYIKECYRILKDNTAMYIFCNANHVDFFKRQLEQAGFVVKNMIIWVKNHWSAGDLKAAFAKQYEILFLVNKGRRELNGKRYPDVWHFDRISQYRSVHQNQKPVDLLVRCLECHSSPGDVVFDGFMGSGSTGVACARTGRNFIGVELDERYYTIARRRIYCGKAYVDNDCIHCEHVYDDDEGLYCRL